MRLRAMVATPDGIGKQVADLLQVQGAEAILAACKAEADAAE
jgi:hydroxymethylbilane synthase